MSCRWHGRRLEDPMLKNNFEWYAFYARRHIPIALHERADQRIQALKAECIDYVNLVAQRLRSAKRSANRSGRRACWIQMGGLCTGILAMLGAPAGDLAQPRCRATNPFTREADVSAGGLNLSEGHFTVPMGPGLGIEVIWALSSAIALLRHMQRTPQHTG